nr:MAG TPA: hypothetical protein [Caudoviricetes sp.]
MLGSTHLLTYITTIVYVIVKVISLHSFVYSEFYNGK